LNLVDQIVFEDGRGNCLAACAASLLNLSIDHVPDFAELGFFAGLRQWLRARRLDLIKVTRCYRQLDRMGVEILHDPHSSRAGIVGEPIAFAWIVGIHSITCPSFLPC